ncbi:ribonuclease Z [Clostridium tetanomorphum]|uniref:Ribonuclease Z n=1 Tax=Clostridium tetanomorphum TaxID=1553 RepID=A0A923ECR8_CLOTT|nr:ribonuclease Z [Clostridium tetanomorphum]KAJ51864.1 ribonuclease Z [Clostridium tetanomorphum DSM 665]MBC2399514.1 ribonuclease Z [Clostridium tetanomorphum]MBP1864133.1 ribonuclease Z [Clostridium tetanomorphum]NRS84546.1 ribonuclease Z [Clostridium tetanomorphum]NRZ97760.1 ribonuclease Z [Clostridium tetanomorphum]
MVNITLLGCGGSLPTPNRFLTSLLINYKSYKILVDCGEGTQVSMKINNTGFKDISLICFTHFHADHAVGLPGLLLTIANSGRKYPLTIIGPMGCKNTIAGLRVLCPELPYEINIIETSNSSENIFSIEDIFVSSLNLDHTIPCNGYNFIIKRKAKFDVQKAVNNKIPKFLWSQLQKHDSVEFEGKTYYSNMVLGEDRPGLKITYLTDTRPIQSIIPFASNSDLFICEGMYGEDTCLDKALVNKHMLFSEAATLALKSSVKELWLTHFSPSLDTPEKHIEKAKNIFLNTEIGKDGMTKILKFSL